jgi:hypothetical protein
MVQRWIFIPELGVMNPGRRWVEDTVVRGMSGGLKRQAKLGWARLRVTTGICTRGAQVKNSSQLSVLSCQLSVLSSQFSAVSFQLSILFWQ